MNARMHLLVIALSAAVTLSAATEKIANDLRAADPNASVDVIVRYKNPPSALHHDRMARRGGKLRRELSLVRSALYSVPASELESLSNDPEIEYISPDRAVRGKLDYAE